MEELHCERAQSFSVEAWRNIKIISSCLKPTADRLKQVSGPSWYTTRSFLWITWHPQPALLQINPNATCSVCAERPIVEESQPIPADLSAYYSFNRDSSPSPHEGRQLAGVVNTLWEQRRINQARGAGRRRLRLDCLPSPFTPFRDTRKEKVPARPARPARSFQPFCTW